MPKDDQDPARRQFLQRLGGVLGSTALAADAVSAEPNADARAAHVPLPARYRFVRLFTAGAPGNALLQVTQPLGRVAIDEQGHVYFEALNSQVENGRGVYRLVIDRSGRATQAATLIEVGQSLPGTGAVTAIGSFDANQLGSFAAALSTDGYGSGIYTWNAALQVRPMVRADAAVTGANATLSAHFRHLDLLNDGGLLFTAHYIPAKALGHASGPSALFFLPATGKNGAAPAPQLLIRSTDRLPGTNIPITAMGVVDGNDNGHYALQAHIDLAPPGNSPRSDGATTALIAGDYRRPTTRTRLVALSPALALLLDSVPGGVAVGETFYNPRIGTSGDVAHVLTHRGGMEMHYRGRRTHATGGQSPSGKLIREITPAAVSERGLAYYTVWTQQTQELVVSNGVQHRTLLQAGDQIQGKTVTAFTQGWHPEQVDRSGRLVFNCEFSDRTRTIVLAIPA